MWPSDMIPSCWWARSGDVAVDHDGRVEYWDDVADEWVGAGPIDDAPEVPGRLAGDLAALLERWRRADDRRDLAAEWGGVYRRQQGF